MNAVATRLKNNFIPNPDNGHKPRVLGPRVIAFVVMVAVIGECAFIFGSTYLIPRSRLYGLVEATALVDETNQNRASNNLPQLQVNPLLQAAAQEKANDMATKGYFAHTSPQGVTPWYWFENVGYSFDYAGENLAVNFSDSQDVTNAWMNSPEHRANILDGDFTQIGIATAQGVYNGQSATYVVEEFGTPAPVAAPVAFVNTAAAASVPTTGPIPQVVTPVATTTAAAKPVTKPVVKSTPSAPAPKPVAVIPTVVAMQDSTSSNTDQSFVAVKAASAETSSVVAQATTTAPVVTAPTQVVTTSQVAPVGTVAPAASAVGLNQPVQNNWVEIILSNPKAVADDFYIFLMVLFGIALILNIFIKIRIQFPKLIAGGLLVIVVSGLCIMLNQNIGLLHAVIL